MGKNNHICFLMVLITLNNCVSSHATLSSANCCVIDDFSGFSIYQDSEFINCTISNTEICMDYDDDYGEKTWEIVHNNLEDGESYSDFDIELSLTYNYTGSMLTQISMFLGSYHHENGTMYEQAPESYGYIGSCTIWDAWMALPGVYCISGYPDGEKEQYTTAYGTIKTANEITFRATRVEGTNISLSILEDGIIKFQHNWSNGITRPLEFIDLALSVDPGYSFNTGINFTSIHGEFQKAFNISIGLPSELCCLVVMLSMGTGYLFKRKKNHY